MMLKLNQIHHIAIICADYEKSKHFYTDVLGLKIVREVYRKERLSYKLDLEVGNQYQIELFSFPNPPARPSQPEACGLRHLAFEVDDIEQAVDYIKIKGILVEPIRIDEYTGKRFTFFADPDGLPIELVQK
jgi:glyoxylase I family protein